MFVIVTRHRLQVLTWLLLVPSNEGLVVTICSINKRTCDVFTVLPSSLPLVGPCLKVLRVAGTSCQEALLKACRSGLQSPLATNLKGAG
jgi:hypothetical protein